jgi:hypothetical protein
LARGISRLPLTSTIVPIAGSFQTGDSNARTLISLCLSVDTEEQLFESSKSESSSVFVASSFSLSVKVMKSLDNPMHATMK